jgi:choline dehydrogenase-like flavoprotein/nucleoside-diphosphate-sugar epimerase
VFLAFLLRIERRFSVPALRLDSREIRRTLWLVIEDGIGIAPGKMPVIDLQSDGNDTASPIAECDLCIIGSGPAGSTIARELSGTGLRVTVLESGGFMRSLETDALNEVENIGRPRVVDQWSVRNRIVGGSSHTWGGRCAAFDAIDLEERSWVPESGWPFEIGDLVPYLDRSAPYLGLAVGSGFSDERFWTIAGRRPPRSEPDPEVLLPFFWQFSRDDKESYPYEYMRIGRHLANRLSPNITLVVGATVLRINPVESGRTVRSVEFAAPDGRRRTLSASTVVVCGGGIENARILLSSDTVTPNGLGNDRDLVGRYFMDHSRGPVGSFEVAGSEALQKRFGRYSVRGHLFRAGLRLSPEIQRAEKLLNCAAWLGEVVASDDPWDALRRVFRGKPQLPGDALAVASNTGLFVRGLKDYFVERNGIPRKLEALTLDAMCEQRPDRDSRVMLSERRDRFGMRLSRIDWRIHEDEPRTMRRMAELVAEQFVRMGLPALELAAWVRDRADFPPTITDVAHPAGTTRMSDDPTKGVVDAQCCVHGVEGLYVAGTSVFPTVGHCNPTQMIVALALRLADHLKAQADAARTAAVRIAATEPGSTRVLVTGATGRIGHVVVSDLLERGYLVRATTSKVPPEGDNHGGALEWRRFDFLDANDYDGLVAGCDAVLHLGAEIGKMERMRRVNLEATGLLAEAAERVGAKAFCYTSSVAIYGSGLKRMMREDAPVLTVDHDNRSEYWALDYVRTYGRTKLGGELALRRKAKTVRYVVLRPTVVVDIPDIIGIRDWSRVKRALAAHRHAHHIYVRDVSDAIIWSMERAIAGPGAPGSIETFNLSEDEFPEPTHADFMRKAFAVSGDPRFRIVTVPWLADWMHDFLRFRTFPLRNPLWRMHFPNDRLRAAGYRLRFGMAHAHAAALETIRNEAKQKSESCEPVF